MKSKQFILVTIVIAQFFCTSLWFAGNAILTPLINAFTLSNNVLAHLTSAVQFGFILGTLSYAILGVADRFSPSKVFFGSALLASLFNLSIVFPFNNYYSILCFRFLVGFFLAGIYPVGMKIAADYFDTGLGKSLGYLVGALVLGTAFPHFLSMFTSLFPWKLVMYSTSGLALLGGILIILFVPDGPYRKKGTAFSYITPISIFKNVKFRAAAFGYFGHMWELYTFWAFVPVILSYYQKTHATINYSIAQWSFLIIAIGSIACIVGGYLSLKWATKKVASTALLISCLCCLISPLAFNLNFYFFILFMLVWGAMVIMDSPLFSTLVAKNATIHIKGTALTLVNCIGFTLTIVSIQILNFLQFYIPFNYVLMFLAIGPILGLISLYKKTR